MKINLQGRIVLVTGASSGLGARTAQLLAARGATLVLTARSRAKLEELAMKLPGEHAVYELDVTLNEQVQEVVSEVIHKYGKIDILLNNAGFGEFIPFADATLAHFAAQMDVNYMGIVRCTHAVLPYMQRQGSGHIVNVASIAGKLATAKSTGYAASKHAVLGFTNALRAELAGSGIAVSAVNPGPIDTPFFDKADPGGEYVRRVKWFMMPVDKVAGAIVRIMETRRAELDMPWSAAYGTKLVQLFPRLTSKLLGRMINQK